MEMCPRSSRYACILVLRGIEDTGNLLHLSRPCQQRDPIWHWCSLLEKLNNAPRVLAPVLWNVQQPVLALSSCNSNVQFV